MCAIEAVTTMGQTAALCQSVGLARATLYRRRRAREVEAFVRPPPAVLTIVIVDTMLANLGRHVRKLVLSVVVGRQSLEVEQPREEGGLVLRKVESIAAFLGKQSMVKGPSGLGDGADGATTANAP